MVTQQFYYFTADYFGSKDEFLVTGRYRQLRGAVLDEWKADYTLVVYFTYCSKSLATETGSERCFYISFASGKSSVIDIAGNEERNTAFYTWLSEVISNDFKLKQFPAISNQQNAVFQPA